MNVTIGIPAYNEEKNIAGIINKLKKIVDTIIVCDDGSSDLTKEIAQELGAIVISHPKNLKSKLLKTFVDSTSLNGELLSIPNNLKNIEEFFNIDVFTYSWTYS